MKTFFTSDTHFGHANIIKYTNRPFASVWQMDEALINNWNGVVRRDDVVYHLGDLSFCSPRRTEEILSRLNGRIHMVKGNHDKRLHEFSTRFESISDFREIYVQDESADRGAQKIVLCHYAMKVWNKRHWGAWQLYGHSHGSLPEDPDARSCDVGVDCWNYTPVAYETLREKMLAKKIGSVDHHRED